MFQPGRLSHWCPSLFVYFLVYHFTVPLVFYGAQAQTVPSKSETDDALETISTFLQNEAGATWLAGLAESQKKAVITTDELMEAVLGVTEENSTVWRAAATLRSALAAQAQRETIPNTDITASSSEPVTDYWSDVITDMEKHDDIICLYRKDTEAKMKKSSDWQKLLKNVSPGYTVHLALDRGSKYVICLKKVNVPTSQAVPTTLITSVEDIPSTTPMLTQITQSSENGDDSAKSTEASTQPSSVPKNTATSATTQAMKSLIQSTTPATIADNISSVKDEKDCGKGGAYKDDNVKNVEDGISNSSEVNHKTASHEPQDKLEPKKLESPPLIARAQDAKESEKSNEDTTSLSESDCSGESDTPEIIEKPRLIVHHSDSGSRSSSTDASRSPVIVSPNCLPCLPNPMCHIPCIQRPCPQENSPNPCQFSRNIDRESDSQMLAARVGVPRFNNGRNMPIWFNSAQPNERSIEPFNKDFKYSTKIPLQPFIPTKKHLEQELWLRKLLSEECNSANRLPLAHPPMTPSFQTNLDCSKLVPPRFGMQDVRKPLMSNARVQLPRVHPTIPAYGSLSDVVTSSNPSFLLPQQNRRVPNSVDFSGADENPFSFRPIIPLFQRGFLPQSLMERILKFPINLPPRIDPQASTQIRPKPTNSQPMGLPRHEPCLQNPSRPECEKNLWARVSPTFTSFNEQIIPSEFKFPSIQPNIFPNGSPSVQRNFCNQNCNQLPSLAAHSGSSAGLGTNFAPKIRAQEKSPPQSLDNKYPSAPISYFSNTLSLIPLNRYPRAPYNARFSRLARKIPVPDSGYIRPGDIHSSMQKNRIPETSNMANKNSIERNMPPIDYSVPQVSRGINKLIQKEVKNAINFSDYIQTMLPVLLPKNLFNAWQISGKQKSNDANPEALHDRACPNSCREPVPLEIKIRGSTADSIRINVVPGKGERVKIIDAKNGLFNVEQKEEWNLSDEVFDGRKKLFKKTSNKSAKIDDAKSLESSVDETADEFEKHVHRQSSTQDESRTAIIAGSLTDSDMKRLEKSSSVTEETAKLNDTPRIIGTTKSRESVNNTSNESNNTLKSP